MPGLSFFHELTDFALRRSPFVGDLYRFLMKVYMKKKYGSFIVQADILPKEAARFCLKRLSLPAFCVEICPASG